MYMKQFCELFPENKISPQVVAQITQQVAAQYELSNLIPDDFKSSLPTIEEIENELNKK